MIEERDFIRASFLNSWCDPSDALYFSVNSDGDKTIMIDLWDDPTRDGLTLRVSFRALGFHWCRDLQVSAATVRAAAQFILRRLRSLDATPAANSRQLKKVN